MHCNRPERKHDDDDDMSTSIHFIVSADNRLAKVEGGCTGGLEEYYYLMLYMQKEYIYLKQTNAEMYHQHVERCFGG